MKVQKIFVKNLRQIDEITTEFNGCTAIITGGNNKGKSTLLKSIVDRLRGDKTNIIKEGKQTWTSERTFTDGSVLSWELLGNSDKLVYTTKEGVKTSSIKEICHKLFGTGFDIDDFLSAQPKKQKEIMQKLVGLDFTDLDQAYEEAYQDRQAKNSIYRAEKAKLEALTQHAVSGEYRDISELHAQITEIEKKNANIRSIEEKMQYKTKRVFQIGEEIQRLQLQINALQEEKKTLNDEIDRGNEWLSTNTIQDTSDLQSQISEQKEINHLHELNKEFNRQHDVMIEAKKVADEADDAVKSIEQQKLDLIKSAQMPQGFEFTDDGLLFNGYTLDRSNLSSSQIYIAGLILASMSLGEVRTLTFDASYLDKNSLAEVEQWANDHDLQLLIERPDFDGGEIRYEIISDHS